MHALAQYIMERKSRALLLAAFFSFLPLFNLMSLVILALITLRMGFQAGMPISLWISLPCVINYWLGYGDIARDQMFSNLLVLLAATGLRNTISWLAVIEGMTTLGILGVLLSYLLVPGLEQMCQQQFTDFYQAFQASGQNYLMDPEDEYFKIFLWLVGKFYIGFYVVSQFSFALIALAIARSMQASLYNPGGFREEFYGFQISRWSMMWLALVCIVSFIGWEFGLYVLPVVIFPFVIHGICLVHSLALLAHHRWLVLCLFYGLMIYFHRSMLVTMIFMVLFDAFFNFRTRFGVSKIVRTLQ